MNKFVHQRHKSPTHLTRPRELIVACVPMRSNVNISQIARTASACAVEKMIICGNASLISKIARDATSELSVSTHRSLAPVLKKLKQNGYRLVGIEQTSNSHNIHDFSFHRRTVLVIGNERLGINDEILNQLDDVIEIPVWGMPHSYNAASAANMALYEYCRQFPQG
ncbi:SpoU rRNA Methylase family protein [Desulfocicer vacuolatum DSM 3385]|uniref:SpoU rRNA Methylase family protein n=1 Tax=Desulfocicer vacuolatum DSM 3385 TaxID=1121400 RepID=A0A1W2CYT1_9BACT|nr:RNA methyltransferase [Desulfocicer vacuolatum]SMC89992.1 SpoU rRNA Methylase family protein [Desulfocicer vacuolatum DSM 3385]